MLVYIRYQIYFRLKFGYQNCSMSKFGYENCINFTLNNALCDYSLLRKQLIV